MNKSAAAALTMAGAIALGGVAVATPPPVSPAPVAAASTLTTAQRSLGLTGATNARDVGGYRTADGHTVRTGLVFRSNNLSQLTPTDLAKLRDRQVVVIDDLRSPIEQLLQPDRVPTGARQNSYDVLGNDFLQSLTDVAAVYPALITAPTATPAYASVLRDIINTSNGSVLYHCTSGKDRTGWATAVLLTLLGVDRQTVTEDYLLSNQYLNAHPGDPVTGVLTSELDSAFATVDQVYGTFDTYVRAGLGLNNADITALKQKMLV